MIKVKLTLLVGFFVMLGLNAQDKNNIELGGNFGLNISNISKINSYEGTSSKISYNIGASAEYYFSDRWGIKTKIIYDRKGWADGFIDGYENNLLITNVDFKLNYLTIPVMANWHFGSTRKWYLNFGPYVGFLLNATEDWSGSDVSGSFNSVDFGLAYSIGYKFPISTGVKLFVEYDAQSGLADVFEYSEMEIVRNGRSSFNVGAIFTVK